MSVRVVITGLGVVAPNGVGLEEFTKAIKAGTSGVTFHQHLKDKGFSCCIGGVPSISQEKIHQYLSPLQLRGFNSTSILYGCIAGIDAWKDAGFSMEEQSNLDYDTGIIFGTGTSGIEKFREAIYKIDDQKVRRLGSTTVVQTMASGISAYLGGILGFGNQVTTNSSACTTGTEALLMGFERIKNGKSKRMLVGSSSDSSLYTWGGFDAMRVMSYKHNESPEKGSRPMSETASGFVPGSGSGALVLESLESALERKARLIHRYIAIQFEKRIQARFFLFHTTLPPWSSCPSKTLVSYTKLPATSKIFTFVPFGKWVPFLPSIVIVW